MEIVKSKVYVKTNERNNIICCEGGYTTPLDLSDWIYIDEGIGDKFNLCQTHYFEGGLYTEDNIPRYKLENNKPILRLEDEINQDKLPNLKTQKEKEISNSCNLAIINGIDVETSEGEEHFSLEETDQINLTTAYNAVLQGTTQYPYHADGKMCRMFTAEEITAISLASISHKLYHTTLCNHLLTWIRRTETKEELDKITYSTDNMPDDLLQNMIQVLAASQSISS